MNTKHLIDALAQDLAAAPPLPRPWVRSAWWLLGAAVYLTVIILMMASPDEVAANAGDWSFIFYQFAALLTAVTATAAAFASTVPGDSGRSVQLAVFSAIVWLGSLGIGAVHEWTRDGGNLAAPGEWGCVAMIIVGGGVPGLVLAVMLRRGAPLTPGLSAGMAALATATLTNIGACLSHPHRSEAVMLVWHGTTILVLVALAAYGGRVVLTWNVHRADSNRPRAR